MSLENKINVQCKITSLETKELDKKCSGSKTSYNCRNIYITVNNTKPLDAGGEEL